MIQPEAITIGLVLGLPHLVGRWPPYTAVEDRLLDEVDPDVAWMREGFLYFRLANAEAVYMDTGIRMNGVVSTRLFKLHRLEI